MQRRKPLRYKLGRLAPKENPKTLRFSSYLTGELPTPHARVYREYKVPDSAKEMFGNDEWGDCVWAMSANAFILASCHAGKVDVPTLTEVLAGYSAVTGFDPTTGANDNGTSMTDAFDYLQTTGLGGRKILGWAKIDHTNLVHRKLGADLFGFTAVGVNLPAIAQDQFSNNQSWEKVSNDGGIEGGHAILRPGFGSQGSDYVSWARWDQKASNAWESAYVDEEYVLITQSWVDYITAHDKGALDLVALQSDLKNLTA
jgi:hypothetical protein